MTDPYSDIGARPQPLSEFEQWYQHYPRKVARGAAEKAFPKALKAAGSVAVLIAGAQRYCRVVAGREARFIAHPATWLNAKRWMDERPLVDETTKLTVYNNLDASIRRVDLLISKGIRTSSLDAADIRLALHLGRITPEQAEKHGFGYAVSQKPDQGK